MRMSQNEIFFGMVKLLEQRSTCLRRNVGAVLVRDGIVLSTGYNGSPNDFEHCEECLRKVEGIPSGTRLEFCRAVHAEQNALIQCAIKQTDPRGSTLFCTASPCVTCAKLLIQAGVQQIYYLVYYPDKLAIEMIKYANIGLFKYDLEKKGVVR